MAILAWDETGTKIYETGTKKGVPERHYRSIF